MKFITRVHNIAGVMKVEVTVIINFYFNVIVQWLFLSTTIFPYANPLFCNILTTKREYFSAQNYLIFS
jgi:hypothetical protein